MLSSVNFLFLLSLAITSWVILCYMESFSQPRRAAVAAPSPARHGLDVAKDQVAAKGGVQSAASDPWTFEPVVYLLDVLIKSLGLCTLLRVMWRHTPPGRFLHAVRSMMHLPPCICLSCILGGRLLRKRWLNKTAWLRQYRLRCEMQHQRIVALERELNELQEMLMIFDVDRRHGSVGLDTASLLGHTSTGCCGGGGGGGGGGVESTNQSNTVDGKQQQPAEGDSPASCAPLMWHKYFSMLKLPLLPGMQQKLVEPDFDGGPAVLNDAGGGGGGVTCKSNNNSSNISNKAPFVVSTEQLQVTQGDWSTAGYGGYLMRPPSLKRDVLSGLGRPKFGKNFCEGSAGV